MKILLRITLTVFVIIFLIVAGGSIYLTVFLPNVPLEEVKVEITPERLKRGEYLATHVAVCIDCHSTRDWTKFGGPIKPGTYGVGGEIFDQTMGFPGKYYSANITPFNLSNWTDAELYRVITSGVKKDGSAIFPVMPFESYAKMDKEDIYSIIAYVRSLKSIESQVPKSVSDFPMNFIINTMPTKAQHTNKPDSKDKIAYGKYLMTAAACKDCHTKFEGGAYVEGMNLAGGREFPMTFGILRSSNLTPDDETGIGRWSKESFIQRFKQYSDPAYKAAEVNEKSFNSIMPWTQYSGMSEEDLGAIYAYLKSLDPIPNKVQKVTMKN